MGYSSDGFYQSGKWKKKRLKILRRDGYKCQLSKRYGRNVEATTVHHIYPREDYPQYELCDWNLISVGRDMNNKLHDRESGKLTTVGLELMRRTSIPPTDAGRIENQTTG